MDLIERQAAIDAVENAFDRETILNRFVRKIAISAIRHLPSAQPEPRTAYWTKDIVGTVICSRCGGIRRDNRIGHTQWCNSCGCFMQGEEDERSYF